MQALACTCGCMYRDAFLEVVLLGFDSWMEPLIVRNPSGAVSETAEGCEQLALRADARSGPFRQSQSRLGLGFFQGRVYGLG